MAGIGEDVGVAFGKWKNSTFSQVTFSLIVALSCSIATSSALRQTLHSLDDLRLGISDEILIASKSIFSPDSFGHFGNKTQYDSVRPDKFGGTYSVHCRNGQCFGIEVKYPAPGINRVAAIATINNLLQGVASKITEHDDTDLRLKDAGSPGEFFYFSNIARAELFYNKDDYTKISQIDVWKK
jgi:hypothetical protein